MLRVVLTMVMHPVRFWHEIEPNTRCQRPDLLMYTYLQKNVSLFENFIRDAMIIDSTFDLVISELNFRTRCRGFDFGIWPNINMINICDCLEFLSECMCVLCVYMYVQKGI